MNHYIAILILSLCIGSVFTLIVKEDVAARLRYFLKLMGYMVLGSFVASWVMYWIP
ncbi:MAG: hypothetical protein V3R94_04350 [Acidobacteriota bacterium]